MFNKDDSMDTNNYRGIALLDSYYKILSLSLLRRFKIYSKDIIGDYQRGFSREKSISDNIFCIWTVKAWQE